MKESSRYGSVVFKEANVENGTVDITLLYNTTATHSMPAYLNSFNSALLRFMANYGDIRTWCNPLPLTLNEQLRVLDYNDITVAVLVTTALCLLPLSFLRQVVGEHRSGLYQTQTRAGISTSIYWLSMFIFDGFMYIISIILIFSLICSVDESALGQDHVTLSLLSLLLFGFAIIPCTYSLVFLSSLSPIVQNVLFFLYLFIGQVLLIVSYTLNHLSTSPPLMTPEYKWLFRLFPNFALGDALLMMVERRGDSFDSLLSLSLVGGNLLMLGAVSIGFVFLSLSLQFISSRMKTSLSHSLSSLCCCMGDERRRSVADPSRHRHHHTHHKERKEEDEDEEVRNERVRVQSGHAGTSMVVVKGLSLSPPLSPDCLSLFSQPSDTHTNGTVEEAWFAVSEGECFVLLGADHSGGPSLVRMLAGDQPSSSGSAYLKGHNVRTAAYIRSLEGYMSIERDILIPSLSLRENAIYFLQISGLSLSHAELAADELLLSLSLSPFANTQSNKCDVGTKRKLCVSLSLIGDPPVLFLDRPTHGVDASCRRFLWSMLDACREGRTLIISSDSAYETERIASHLAVMIDGRVRCLGTPSHITERYCMGHQLQVYVTNSKEIRKMISRWVHSMFPGSRLLERRGVQMRFRLPLSLPLSVLFEYVERERDRLGIVSYTISRMSLEQVFFYLKDVNE